MRNAGISRHAGQVVAGMVAGTLVMCALSGTVASAPSRSPGDVVPGTNMTLGPAIPRDIDSAGGAPAASLDTAALYAWQTFFALNWPAKKDRRGEADRTASFEAPADVPRVWETYKARVEAYPGMGAPWGSGRAPSDYGFHARPRYQYSAEKIAGSSTAPGITAPCSPATVATTPWHNLDEPNHNGGRSGASPAEKYPGQQILLESKVNWEHFGYVAARGWYGEHSIRDTKRATGTYVRTHLAAPLAGRVDRPADDELISFPDGAMELKAAWRRIGSVDAPERFFSRPVRYYRSESGHICHIDSGASDDRWGMVAMHVMQKTPSAPYFIWATFEHVDNVLTDERDSAGRPVPAENPDGTLTAAGAGVSAHYSPEIEIEPATFERDEQYRYQVHAAQPAQPGVGLYFLPAADSEILPPMPPGVSRIDIKARVVPTPAAIARINALMQQEIRKRYPNSPLQFYRLVSVQWKPLTKAPTVDYTGPEEPAVYYAANVIIEPPPVHQKFSGQLLQGFDTATDYLFRDLIFLNPPPNPGAPVFNNTYFGGKAFLSGGCMGCHGARQAYGADWSFLLDRQRVLEPEIEP